MLRSVKGGAPVWRFDYSHGGKRKTLSLGVHPDIGLALARKKVDDARKLIAAGTDPSAARKADKAERGRQAEAQQLADAGLPGPGSFEATRIRFEQDAFPWIGRRPIAEVDAPELLLILRRVTEHGAIETAHRLKDVCRQVFRYGIATGA